MGATVKHTPANVEEARALLNGKSKLLICNSTYLVSGVNGDVFVEYHGNRIVSYTEHGIYATWAGWGTSTTTTRLNQLCAAQFKIKGGEAYVDGEETRLNEWVKVG